MVQLQKYEEKYEEKCSLIGEMSKNIEFNEIPILSGLRGVNLGFKTFALVKGLMSC